MQHKHGGVTIERQKLFDNPDAELQIQRPRRLRAGEMAESAPAGSRDEKGRATVAI
jgi:hypothetical protein